MDFQQLLQEHGVHCESEGRYSRNGWINFRCPWCRGGKDPNKLYCGYSLAYNSINCWRCGKHSTSATLGALLGLSYHDALELSKDLAPNRAIRLRDEDGEFRQLILPKNVGPLKRAHRDYLRVRGFDPREIESRWNVRGIGEDTRFPWRLFIPIEFRGQCVSWTTRHVTDSPQLRYISASATEEKMPHKKILYGEDFVQDKSAIAVVEGSTDNWAFGPGWGVSLMGTGFTNSQIRRISKYPKRLIVFDPEPEAQVRANLLCEALKCKEGRTFNCLLETGDPASCKKREINQIKKLLK